MASAEPLADKQVQQQHVAGTDADGAPSAQGSALEQLKKLWGQATAEERQKFLGWALD